jgi:hypothetical protein
MTKPIKSNKGLDFYKDLEKISFWYFVDNGLTPPEAFEERMKVIFRHAANYQAFISCVRGEFGGQL